MQRVFVNIGYHAADILRRVGVFFIADIIVEQQHFVLHIMAQHLQAVFGFRAVLQALVHHFNLHIQRAVFFGRIK